MTLWKAGSIHNRLILMALAPALLLGLIVFAYFVSARLDDVERQLQDTGELIASQLAPTAEYGVISGNLGTLESLLGGALEIKDVRSVSVLDKDGRELLSLTDVAVGDAQPPLRYFSADIMRQRIALENELYLLDTPELRTDDSFRYLGQVRVGLSSESFTARQEDILYGALLLASLVMFAAAVLALRLAKSLASPLQRMSVAVQSLQDGNLDTQLSEDQQYEMGQLINNINALARTLKRADAEQRRAMMQITSAREEAEAANRAKSDFLAMMSHELRTPMNGVLGMLQLLETTELNQEQSEYVEIAGESTDHLLRVINDILDFSRIERGVLELEHIPFALDELIHNSAMVFEHTASQKGLSLKLSSSGRPDLPMVLGDPTRIRQILVNLIGNALKFTEHGQIRVDAHWQPEGQGKVLLECRVEDTGIGIEQAQLESMFDAFQQADSSTSRRFGGTGLGLSIARTFALKMGGQLEATSAIGQGSCFILRLSLPLADKPALSEQQGNMLPVQSKLPLLLVEDNPVNQMVIEGMLRSMSHQVVTVENGHRALQQLKDPQQAFSMILMDLQLPDMDGLTTFRQYLQACETAQVRPIPCVALTASAFEGDRQQCASAGMQGFLTKPLTRAALQKELDKWLAQGANGQRNY